MLATHMARHFTKIPIESCKQINDPCHRPGPTQTTFTVCKGQFEASLLIKSVLISRGFNVCSSSEFNVLRCNRRSAYMHDNDMRLEISFIQLTETLTQLTVRNIGTSRSLMNQPWLDRQLKKLQTLVEVAVA